MGARERKVRLISRDSVLVSGAYGRAHQSGNAASGADTFATIYAVSSLGQLEACAGIRHPHLRSATVTANNYYNLTNHSPAAYETEARSTFEGARAAPTGGRSFDSVTDCRWRARDDGDGAYLRPYVPDEGPRSDRAVYKSAYLWEDSADNRRFTERRKKTVRFDGHEGAATFPRGGRDASGAPHDWASLRWESERQTSQDSATKDSGIDTSSTFTSSEDSNRGDCPKVHYDCDYSF